VVAGGERGEGREVVDEKLVLMARGSASRFAFPSRQDLSAERVGGRERERKRVIRFRAKGRERERWKKTEREREME